MFKLYNGFTTQKCVVVFNVEKFLIDQQFLIMFSVTVLRPIANGTISDGHVQASYESPDEQEPLLRPGKGSINS